MGKGVKVYQHLHPFSAKWHQVILSAAKLCDKKGNSMMEPFTPKNHNSNAFFHRKTLNLLSYSAVRMVRQAPPAANMPKNSVIARLRIFTKMLFPKHNCDFTATANQAYLWLFQKRMKIKQKMTQTQKTRNTSMQDIIQCHIIAVVSYSNDKW